MILLRSREGCPMSRLLYLSVSLLLLSLGCPTETCPSVGSSPDCSYPEFVGDPPATQASSGTYTQHLTSAAITTDCLPSTIDPIAARTYLEGETYRVEPQADGALCIGHDQAAGTDQPPMGCGPIAWNRGTLVARYTATDGICEWTVDNSISVVVTAKNTLSISFIQQRSKFQPFMAAKCLQVQPCSISYSATLTGP